MREAASQVLSERAETGDGLQRHVVVSLAAHGLALAALLFGPTTWVQGDDSEVLNVMSIRLGGPEGPGEGGLTALGARPIQEVITMPEATRPQWIQPPADTAPEVVVPTEATDVPRLEPESEVETAPEEARGRQLTRGPRLQDGTAMSDTGAEGMGVGLSAGGLGGTGTEISVADFCCPEYLATMMSLIRERWDRHQRAPGATVVRFTVHRDGAIEGVGVDRSSGYTVLDLSARRAVLMTQQLPPLPSAFTEDSLTIRLTFEYRP